MLKSLLPYIADIKRITVLNSGGEDYKSYSTVYESIPCRYYLKNKRLKNTNLATESSLDTKKIILEGNYSDIKFGDEITVIDVSFGEIGTYLIEDIKLQRLFSTIHHIELTITEL